MDLRKLKTLIDLVQQSGIAELEITEGEEKVRITRGVPGGAAQGSLQPAAVYMAPPAGAAAPAGAPVAAAPAAEPVPEGHIVKAPMVGTFYRSSAQARNLLSRWETPSSPVRRCASSKR